jgi:hypothetical protein
VVDYRSDHPFGLRQALAAYRHTQRLIKENDAEVQAWLGGARVTDRSRCAPRFDLRTELYRILGADLTQVARLQIPMNFTVFSEPGLVSARTTESLGGKVLFVKTRHVKHRVSRGLRMAAQSLWRHRSVIAGFFRRMQAKLGDPAAITTMTHKFARTVYHLLTTREPYEEDRLAVAEAQHRQRSETGFCDQARALGFQLVPAIE